MYVGVCSRLVDNFSLSESTVLYVVWLATPQVLFFNSLQKILNPSIETYIVTKASVLNPGEVPVR
jgi:hypothetical protein